MWKPKSKEEREMGPEMGEGVLQTIEGLTEEERKKKTPGAILAEAAVLLLGMVMGTLAAFLLVWLRGAEFGWYTWPLVLCANVFVLSSIGFFVTDGAVEKIYGIGSMISFASVMVQVFLLF